MSLPPSCSHSKTARQVEHGRLEPDAKGVWHVYSHADVKALLRLDGTRQAGFKAELVGKMPRGMRLPVLYQEGEEHRAQRTQIAKFFTPATISKSYRPFMERLADALVADLKRTQQADLSALSMTLAVQVAAQVVGLTDSRLPGMDRRIDSFFDQPRDNASRLERSLKLALNQWRMAKFYFLDVRPAIATRRKSPREDVISHLLSKGYKGLEILTECITYGAAGMATTREFISVAAWHLLDNPELRANYLAGDEATRHRLLHELLRLEPVVGHLYRTAERDLTLERAGETVTIPAGARIDLHIAAANSDAQAVGPEPHCVRARALAPGVQPSALSFGDGHHRCPGAYIAIYESDIFLQRLLALDLRIVKSPTVSYSDLTQGYELRNFIVAVV